MDPMPDLTLSFSHIKTPQLIGIIAGCTVFVATISAVIMLLYKSGTLGRFAEEMTSGAPLSLKTGKKENVAPQSSTLPELYEHLLLAASTLPLQPSLTIVDGKNLSIRALDLEEDVTNLILGSNGSALYGESAYDPSRIWGWISSTDGNREPVNTPDASSKCWPSESPAAFRNFFQQTANSQHLVIVDRVTQKQVGMMSLVDNRPQDLSIRIDNLWITPAFQTKKYSHEAFFHALKHLFVSNYRRVTVEVDIRNIVMRKFLERCGFVMESVMRKHRILDNRNRDSAVYIILNSDWDQISVKLKSILGLNLRDKMHKVAEIEETSSSAKKSVKNVPGVVQSKEHSATTLSTGQKKKLKKKLMKEDVK